MIRRFQFEAEIYETFSCVPMAGRRKLDRVGLKVSLEQWQKLGRGERLMICHAPAESDEECDALRLFVREVTFARCGVIPKDLPDEVRQGATPPAAPPPQLIDNAKAAGVTITQNAWDGLDDDERYALIKLGGGAPQSHNLEVALAEFLGPAAEQGPGGELNRIKCQRA
jgi:hypothetical protein